MNTSNEILHIQVHQKLGRCMIRLQEYERLLKAMLAGMSTDGPAASLQAVRSQRASSIHGKSLGLLVQMFTADYLVSESRESQADESRASDGEESLDGPCVSLNFRIVLPSDHHARIKESLARMIAMRNELVHHLLESFDLSDEDGCAAACDHLDSCHEEVAKQLSALRGWAEGTTQLATLLSSVLESPAFDKVFSHGIENARTGMSGMDGVIACLKMAEAECTYGGWTSIDSAIMYLTRVSPDERPNKYGYRTWRQLLARSEQFEVRVDKGNDATRGQTWYRSRSDQAGRGRT